MSATGVDSNAILAALSGLADQKKALDNVHNLFSGADSAQQRSQPNQTRFKPQRRGPPPPLYDDDDGSCHICGDPGHWANRCPQKRPKLTNKEVGSDPNLLKILEQQQRLLDAMQPAAAPAVREGPRCDTSSRSTVSVDLVSNNAPEDQTKTLASDVNEISKSLASVAKQEASSSKALSDLSKRVGSSFTMIDDLQTKMDSIIPMVANGAEVSTACASKLDELARNQATLTRTVNLQQTQMRDLLRELAKSKSAREDSDAIFASLGGRSRPVSAPGRRPRVRVASTEADEHVSEASDEPGDPTEPANGATETPRPQRVPRAKRSR
jgi:uncharacterized protein YoxC